MPTISTLRDALALAWSGHYQVAVPFDEGDVLGSWLDPQEWQRDVLVVGGRAVVRYLHPWRTEWYRRWLNAQPRAN